jgi:nucleotide-binding universal stress UspA family protein
VSAIVVGVDGSEGSIRALRFALDEARVRGVELRVVHAWHIPPAIFGSGWAPTTVDLDEYRKLAEASLARALADAGVDDTALAVTPVLREGEPVDVLCAEAAHADLVVVGSRGLGGFRGLLLGSVSQQVVHHAPCPVVVVPGKDRDGDAGDEE